MMVSLVPQRGVYAAVRVAGHMKGAAMDSDACRPHAISGSAAARLSGDLCAGRWDGWCSQLTQARHE